MFDEQAYLDANPDLPDSWTDAEAQSHYLTFGFAEGRDVYWTAADYISLNPDLAGMTDEEAFSHWVVYGKDEGRVPWFQADEYIAANGDLAGMSDAEALSHWINFGKAEGRLKGFDADAYIELYGDLPTTWTYAEALNHYTNFGQAEGRAFDPFVEDGAPPVSDFATTVGNVTTLNLDVPLDISGEVVDGGAGTQTLRLIGDGTNRIDFTNPADQLEGLDLDGNGLIAVDGTENDLSGAGIATVSNFEVVDAYARNPIDESDLTHNFFGDINYDGTGFNGDGVNTDGNIFLGGLGIDTAFGGIGNDFMAGGAVAAGRYVPTGEFDGTGAPLFTDTLTGLTTNAPGADALYGGRNADFFFVELSALDNADGNGTFIDGGSTWDDDPTQDSDWVLLEGSDDDEPITVNLGVNIALASGTAAVILDVENMDASGDLYSFLDAFDAVLGGMRDYQSAHAADGTENSGLGSTGQLVVNGTAETNVVVGGYDNDTIDGAAGDDVLFGGKINYLLANANNPNLLDADDGLDLNTNSVGTVNDGRDTLLGGAGDDVLVFEMDGGNYEGGAVQGTTGNAQIAGDNDILFATDFSMGRMQGQTAADELAQGDQAQADALAALTTDSTVRIDLGVGNGNFYRGYGGADALNNEIAGQNFTADQTNYASGVGRATIQDMAGVIATGLGDVDYDADGANESELSARYQANFNGIDADMDLRGVDAADAAGAFGYNADGTLNLNHNVGDETLYANTGDDILEGRQGNDLLSGGQGHDDFIFNLNGGDDVDVLHRQDDEDVNGIWDGTFSQDYRVLGDGISADPSTVTFSINNPDDVISVLFTLDGTPLQAAGAGITSATTIEELATEANTQLSGLDASLSAAAVDGNLVITDAAGRAFTATSIAGDLGAEDFIASAVIDNGTPSQSTDEIDRVLFKSYESRQTNLGTDDQQASLGANAYAEDLVVGFVDDGAGNITTNLVNGQQYDIQFQNLGTGDVVTVSINGVDYTRTVAVGETTDAFVINFAAQINNQTLDLGTTSGNVNAAKADVFTLVGGATAAQVAAEAVLQLTENDGLVYMATPVVTITNPNGTPGTFAVADVSATTVELFEYDGQNNELNEDTVLFVGNSGATVNYGRSATDPTDISDGSDYSWSVLATALTAGGTLTGSDAILVDLMGFDGVNDSAMHGDDLLIGGAGDDVINAGTGDDEIVGSAGNDTVDGGGNEAAGIYVFDSIDDDINGTVDDAEAGDLQDANGAADYVDRLVFNEDLFAAGTTFDIAVGGIGQADSGTVTVGGASTGVTTYTNIEQVYTFSDTANDTIDFSTLSDEIAAITTAGATQTQRDMLANEGVTFTMGGVGAGMTYDVDANNDDDTADAGENNAPGSAVIGVENVIGGGANDTVIVEESQIGSTNNIDLAGNANDEGALTVGQDTVVFDHNNVGWTAAQTPDMTVAVGPANTIVTFTQGVLQAGSVSDTLVNVEVVDVTTAATGANNADTLDVSAIAGAVVNYGAARNMGDTMEPNGNAADNTSAQVADEAVLATGGVSAAGNGQGAETLIVTSITLMERVNGSTGDDRVLLADNMQDMVAPGGVTTAAIGFDSAFGLGTGVGAVQVDPAYNGLFQFNLGDGTSDALDYRNETGDVYVVLASDDTTADRIIVDQGANGDLTNNVEVGNRVDLATGVERYFGGTAANAIDLTLTTVATTVEFSRESQANSNEYVDPDGHLATADTNILGIEVRSTSGSDVYGRFMDAPANAQGFNAATAWNWVVGNELAQTVVFSDNESAAAQNLDLKGGANVVNYSAVTDDVTLALVATVDNVPAGTNADLTSTYTATPAGGVADNIAIDRATAAGTGTLTVIGSGEANDVVDISGLAATVANGYHVVNLTTGVVTEDVLNTNSQAGNFSTTVQGFEDVTGSAFVDHITGNGQVNALNGGLGNDEIQGKGGADILTGGAAGADADIFIYDGRADGNVVVAGDTVNNLSTDFADYLPDFTSGTDALVVTGALQALLEADGTVHQGAAGSFDQDADGIFVSTTALVGVTFAADNVAQAAITVAVGAMTGVGTADDEALFVLTDGAGASGLYYFQDVNGDGAVDAADTLSLIAWTDNTPIVGADIITRIESGAGSEIIDTASDGLIELIFDAQSDSTLGSRDELDNWDAQTGRIDLSAFALGNGVDVDLNNTDDNLDVIITQSPVSVDGASNMPDFFLDTVNDVDGIAGIDMVDRAVVVQNEVGTTNYRVFVDINGDGNFTSTDDLVVDITNEVAGGTDDVTDFTIADFIFA